jgi:hypothetical protein
VTGCACDQQRPQHNETILFLLGLITLLLYPRRQER